tara:strand:+ start:1998 stop:2582 length:585 start_codon:yes stop_codon:yes gene_type:complete
MAKASDSDGSASHNPRGGGSHATALLQNVHFFLFFIRTLIICARMKTQSESFEAKKRCGLLLQEAAALLRREFEHAAGPEGLTLTQWRVMGQLAQHPDGLRQAALGKAINASAMTVSDVAERLEGAGFIRREPDPGDSRAKLVRVTPQGAVLLDRMRETASGILGRALAGLAEDDRTMLADLLGQVIANLQDRP